jgi:GT2 family glycosyltransferase
VLTAIIPVHNRADLLERLLDSIARQTLPFAEIVVVDNASTDRAVELSRTRGCRVIGMGENAGFARAVNQGWKASATEWVAILNSDVELDSRWLERMMAGIGDAAYAAGMILDAANRDAIDGTYDLLSRAACAWRAGHGEPAGHGKPAGHGEPVSKGGFHSAIAIAPGTACIFRRDVLNRLDGFDERYGSYLEDVDLGLRCLREGLTGVYIPDAVAWHHGSATLGRWNPQVVRLISRNQLMLVARHYDRALFRSCFWPIVAGQVLWGLVALRHGRALAWISGKVEGLRGFRLEAPASPQSSAKLRAFLLDSESEIRRRATGPYWRWYFRLVAEADRPGVTTAAH